MITEFDYSFCPNCGKNLTRKDGNLLLCLHCGLHYYVNPKPTNAVILKNASGEILLVERKHEPKKGYWDLPGGFIDIDETVEESIHREVKEELNVTVTDLQYLTSFCDRYEFGGVKAYCLCALFEARMIDPENLKPSDDAESISFFASSKLPFERFAFESMKDALQQIFKEE